MSEKNCGGRGLTSYKRPYWSELDWTTEEGRGHLFTMPKTGGTAKKLHTGAEVCVRVAVAVDEVGGDEVVAHGRRGRVLRLILVQAAVDVF